MAKESYHRQVVARVYKSASDELKALAEKTGETEAELIRIAIDRYLVYRKRQEKQS